MNCLLVEFLVDFLVNVSQYACVYSINAQTHYAQLRFTSTTRLAQWLARRTSNPEVPGSSPGLGAYIFFNFLNVRIRDHRFFATQCSKKSGI